MVVGDRVQDFDASNLEFRKQDNRGQFGCGLNPKP